MNHFGIAFGAITAAVIGGAVYFDHALKDKDVAVPAPANSGNEAATNLAAAPAPLPSGAPPAASATTPTPPSEAPTADATENASKRE